MGVSSSSGIKSVTRGILTFTAGQFSVTATIPAVNLAKTEVRNLGCELSSAGGPTVGELARLYLNNATTIGAIKGSSGYAVTVTYEITEWY